MAEDQNKSHVSANIEWSTGQESDFKELHEAISKGSAKKDEYNNEESGDDDDEKDLDQRAFADFSQVQANLPNREDSSSEEDDSEPEEPGPKFLWAAQHNNVDLIRSLHELDPKLVKFADSDGYTALHRAAYSGSKVLIHYIYVFILKN